MRWASEPATGPTTLPSGPSMTSVGAAVGALPRDCGADAHPAKVNNAPSSRLAVSRWALDRRARDHHAASGFLKSIGDSFLRNVTPKHTSNYTPYQPRTDVSETNSRPIACARAYFINAGVSRGWGYGWSLLPDAVLEITRDMLWGILSAIHGRRTGSSAIYGHPDGRLRPPTRRTPALKGRDGPHSLLKHHKPNGSSYGERIPSRGRWEQALDAGAPRRQVGRRSGQSESEAVPARFQPPTDGAALASLRSHFFLAQRERRQ
jgi:hypothetical protein